MAFTLYSGAFTGTGNGTSVPLHGKGVLSIWGTFVATLALERSHDGGTTWVPVSRDNAGTAATFSGATTQPLEELEEGIHLRLRCSSYTSGTANWRFARLKA